MLLAIDIGNTNTVFGLYRVAEERASAAGAGGAGGGVLVSWRASTRRDRMPDEWFAFLAPLLAGAGYETGDVSDVIVSSVVPSVTTWMVEMSRQRLGIEPVVVGIGLGPALGLRVRTDSPAEVGADRLANSVAAFARYGGPAIVVDFGTATTFDVVSAEGDYLGGAIAPGMTISLDALSARAARLFTVELALPAKVIGTSTAASMQSGVVLGYLAMLEGMVERIREELGAPATVIVTGGYAEVFAAASPLIAHHDRDLTIDGLRLIHRRVAASAPAEPLVGAEVAAGAVAAG